MKNIFKIMGIAVLACGMMVACNKPEEDNNNNNNDNGGGNNNQQEQQDGFFVTMKGATWQAVDFLARYTEETEQYDAYLTLEAYKTADDDSPYVKGFLQASVVSGATYNSTGGDYITYTDPNDIYVDSEGILSRDGQPGQYYNFAPDVSSFVENITAIDVNATKISGDWKINYVDIPTYIANQGSYAGAQEMKGVMRNAVWTAAK